jgi:outer membrane protein OmpA-like peptidoglycan-associated protein
VNNDAYGVNLLDAFKDGYDFDLDAKKTFTTNNSATTNTDFMGPSFMFNIAPKHSLAVYTRARAFVNVVDINGSGINEIAKDNSNSFPSTSIGSPNAVENSWGELGISYAAVLFQKGQHFVKGGVTAKYLQGVANYHFQGKNVSVSYNEDLILPQNSTYTTTGTAVYGSSQDFNANSDVEIDRKSKGFGFDMGLTYEWRPDYDASRADINDLKYVNKYKLRFGVSVTDLGSMRYDQGIRNNYDLNRTYTKDDLENADDFEDLYPVGTPVNGDVKSFLPTAIHADVDWNIHNKFYLNLNGDFSVVSNTKLNQNSIANRMSLTPRFESRWFSFYVPVSYFEMNKETQVGVGLRTGVFFVGSGSAISNLVSNNSKGADVHLGVKIPVYHKKAKDKDGDGILDKEDNCPTEAGPIENKGCPWSDTDKDGVLDKDDKCPSIAGQVENQGCPWGDADSDSVLDNVDACPSVAGPVENNGCPWPDTDNDGVLDKDDKCPTQVGLVANGGCPDTDKDGLIDIEDDCPTVVGPKSNKGCPEVTIEVIEKLKIQAKSVFFNSGKSTFKTGDAATITSLAAMKEILKDYPTAKFSIEGHTDSDGSDALNQKLSEDRANAVRNFLIEKGIKADNLTATGYGESKPIASNKTKAGKALNRRTEVKHVGTIYEGRM